MALILMVSTMFLGTIWMWIPVILSAVDHLQRTGGYYGRYWIDAAPLLSAVLALAVASMTWVLRRPTGSLGPPTYRRGLRYARLGLIFYGFCIALLSVFDSVSNLSGLDHFGIAPADIDRHRCGFRLALDVTVLLALVGFRPVLRFISVRSLDHRLGRVGRQGTRAMILAALVATTGDVLRLVVGWSLRFGIGFGSLFSGLAVLGVVLIAIGEAMLTLALLNATFDAIRLARGIARPSYLREDIIG